ncbi:tolB protein-like protein [Actinidia rufa]|uniref:TolB protein-like protein n=1 Tax=Actinidia rufa TaxID=165716 RepID=A0A7J0G0X1_9ERIC|nr:tolB protein-like protein [Actinidia rufa]
MHNPDDVAAFGIYVIHLDHMGLRKIHVAGVDRSGGVDRERTIHVCYRADGEWLLLAANLEGVTAEPVSVPNQFQPFGDLHMVRLDGSGLLRLTCNGYENGTPKGYLGAEPDLGQLGLV